MQGNPAPERDRWSFYEAIKVQSARRRIKVPTDVAAIEVEISVGRLPVFLPGSLDHRDPDKHRRCIPGPILFHRGLDKGPGKITPALPLQTKILDPLGKNLRNQKKTVDL
jgi:hypothetical protein